MPIIQFSHPWWLLLLPCLVAGAVYVARHSMADLRGSRAPWSLGLRIGILVLCSLALAGLQVSQPARKLAVLFVLDQSDSIPPDQKRQALEYVNQASRRMGPEDEAGVVVFGTDAYVELETRPRLSLRQIHSRPGRDYSNLSGAIRLALAAFPEDAQRRVVLISDGNENLGNAVQEAEGVGASRVQVDVVPVVYRYEREALLEKLSLPGEAKVGEPFEVRVIARSTYATPATIRLLRNGALIAQQKVDLLEGPNVVVFRQSLEEARFHTYEAVIETPGDQLAENNRGLGFVLVRGKPRVLIVDPNPNDARYLAAALEGQQLQVEVRRPGQLPTTLAEFQSYDSVVLSNTPAYQLTPDQMKSIRSSVRDLGAGLVMVGGEDSFGPGAYRGTPIEEALPVDMEVRKQKVMPIGAVAMILHTCEFPDGNRWAAETAASVVNVLGDRDKVGVLLYDMGGENWGIKMQPASNKARLKSEIYNLDPGDAPDFGALMKMAHQGLTVDARDASVKHMIMISDGDPQPPSAQLMAQIRQAKITVSTVAVFPHSGGTGTLQDIARAGKGQFYNVKKPQEIPQIFLKEAQRVMKPAIIEERFVPDRLPGAQLLEGIDRVPALLGYVATSPKEAASVEVALASRREDPILVSWRYGLGKAVAFTSDAKNRWAAPWLTSSAMFSRFWAQTIRWTVRSTARADMDTQVEIQQRKGKVVVDVLDSAGDFVNLLDIRGSVAGQNVSSHLRMDQTAPGRYEGEFDAPEKGQYMVGLQYVDEKGVPRLQTVGAAVPYSPEYRNLAANTAVLSGLAERTSGRIYPTLGPQPHRDHLTRIWRRDQRAFSTPQDLWAGLLLLAVLLLPADIAVRRLMISREELVAFLGLVRDQAMTRLGLRRPERTREEGMGRLMTARRRAARQMGVDVPEEGPEPQPAPAPVSPPERSPAYSGPIRRMPTVEGAGSVTAPPAAAGSRTTPPPDLERVVEPQVSPPAEPVAAPPPAPVGSNPTRTEPDRPRSRPEVVWNRPIAGVTPETPTVGTESTGIERTPPTAPEPPPEEGGSRASRLLRAKQRARERDEEK